MERTHSWRSKTTFRWRKPGIMDKTMRYCNAPVRKGHSAIVAVAGLLLGFIGLSMVGIGASWDVTVPDDIYTVTWKERYYTDFRHAHNHVLIYQGFMVFIAVIPGIMHLHKRVRLSVIVFLLSLPTSLAGSLLGAIMSGFSWKAVALVYKAKTDGHCSVVGAYCSCTLPSNNVLNRTIHMEVSRCEDIDYLHSTINAYFALSIISAIVTLAVGYMACMICCTPEKKEPRVELCTVPSSKACDPTNIDVRENGLMEDNQRICIGKQEPTVTFAPAEEAEDGGIEWQDQSRPLLASN